MAGAFGRFGLKLAAICVCEIGSGQAAAAPRCDSTLEGSVGMEGWRISCWPQDSQFAYAPGSSGIMAVTTTNTTKANDWVSLSVSLLDTTTSKVAPVATATAFQPLFSPDGKQLAYTIADDEDYVWSQCCKYTSNPPLLVISGSILKSLLVLTGHICVVDTAKAMAGLAKANTKCDTHGTCKYTSNLPLRVVGGRPVLTGLLVF